MAQQYDLVILGGGTGGYVAAIRAAQLGLKTAIVEQKKLGGTCLHHGCIPSKALLKSAAVYQQTKHAQQFGIQVGEATLQFDLVQQRKEAIIEQLHKGVVALIKKGKIDVYYGTGRILGPSIFSPMPGTISVEMADGTENEMLIPTNIIVATGSKPRTLDGIKVDGDKILTSDSALQLESLPQSIIIVGGGVIGIEWASMLCDFDVDVTVLEAGPQILPTEDRDVANEMARILQKRGVKIITNAQLQMDSLQVADNVSMQVEHDGQSQMYTAEKLLLSVGRVGNTAGIGLENTDIEVIQNTIVVNDVLQTKESHIYAIGDVIGGMQLAHVASHEGIRAVEHIAGLEPHVTPPHQIARCIYGAPEIASVGYTEHQAQDAGIETKTAKFPFKAVGKALIEGEAEGFAKLVVDVQTNDVVGVHLIGPQATNLIAEGALAMFLNATPWEMGAVIHPHPSLSEVIGEVALAFDGRAIHF